jgi:DNA polymerase-3 subunit alpha
MLLSRLLGGFTRGQSDELRKAMGKKIREKLDALKPKFLEGAQKNGHDTKVCEKIWGDWEAFAAYAFNKSHATCYSWVAYQTAYLKANYPAEYMAAVLSRNISNIDEITKFMGECKRMGIEVLIPDVNESNMTFTVNKEGNIRFGLGAIKGVGENAVANIVEERKENGQYKDIYDLIERVNLQMLNKKTMESLAGAGAFDSFGIPRSAFFVENKDGVPFFESLLRFGVLLQQSKNSSQQSLFGESSGINVVQQPEIPRVDDWSDIQILSREKELIGMYLSSHPLDEYKLVIESFTNADMIDLHDVGNLNKSEIVVAGIVTKVQTLTTKTGNPYGRFAVEDYSGSHEFTLFSKDFIEFGKFFVQGVSLMIRGSVQERFNFGRKNDNDDKPKELEFKIKKIELLSEVKQSGVRNLTINIPLVQLTEDFIDEFVPSLTPHAGNTTLTIKLMDEDICLECFARKQKVSVSPELLGYFDENQIPYKIS